jgi:hypothetical protein
MQSGNIKVTLDQVNKVLEDAEIRDEKWWGNTTIVSAKLKNGWVVTETSSCVDPDEYDHKLGVDICMRKITDKVWLLLGWSLNCKHNGEML